MFKKSDAITCAVCALAGYAAIWFPWRLAVVQETSTATNPVDGMQIMSIALLFLIGAVAGLSVPRKFWLWGLATMAAFPVIAITEMIQDPTSHNLFPIEFFIYGLLMVPAVLGAGLGCLIRLRLTGSE